MQIRKKTFTCLITAFSLILSLSGCRSASGAETDSTNNYDGVNQSAEKTGQLDGRKSEPFSDTFTSQDGTVTFQVSLDTSLEIPDMPIVQVAPHFLTEEDAKNAAIALCGSSAEFYEAEPVLNERYTKSDVIAQIERWSPYTSADKLKLLFPNGNAETWESDAQTLRDGITFLTGEYLNADAPDYTHTPCQWTFYKESHYLYGEDAAVQDTSKDNDQICVYAANDNGTYQMVTIARRNQPDFILNNISYMATTSGPIDIDYALYRAEKLRTERPTEEQMRQAVQNAEAIMERMNLRTWEIVSPHIGEYQAGNYMEYIIHITAVPVFNGFPAIDRPQISNLKSARSSNYYLTKAAFDFAPDGSLMKFNLYSPVDVKQVHSGTINVLPGDELLTHAKAYLMGFDLDHFEKDSNNTLNGEHCDVCITDVQYGLVQSMESHAKDSIQYVPAVMYSGSVSSTPKDSTEPYYAVKNSPLLLLNALDSSVIPLQSD